MTLIQSYNNIQTMQQKDNLVRVILTSGEGEKEIRIETEGQASAKEFLKNGFGHNPFDVEGSIRPEEFKTY